MPSDSIRVSARFPVSPERLYRAWLDGRDHITPEDVQAVFTETIAHRLVYQPVHEMHRHDISPRLMAGILAAVAAP